MVVAMATWRLVNYLIKTETMRLAIIGVDEVQSPTSKVLRPSSLPSLVALARLAQPGRGSADSTPPAP
jgi:hypothetical protein